MEASSAASQSPEPSDAEDAKGELVAYVKCIPLPSTEATSRADGAEMSTAREDAVTPAKQTVDAGATVTLLSDDEGGIVTRARPLPGQEVSDPAEGRRHRLHRLGRVYPLWRKKS